MDASAVSAALTAGEPLAGGLLWVVRRSRAGRGRVLPEELGDDGMERLRWIFKAKRDGKDGEDELLPQV